MARDERFFYVWSPCTLRALANTVFHVDFCCTQKERERHHCETLKRCPKRFTGVPVKPNTRDRRYHRCQAQGPITVMLTVEEDDGGTIE